MSDLKKKINKEEDEHILTSWLNENINVPLAEKGYPKVGAGISAAAETLIPGSAGEAALSAILSPAGAKLAKPIIKASTQYAKQVGKAMSEPAKKLMRKLQKVQHNQTEQEKILIEALTGPNAEFSETAKNVLKNMNSTDIGTIISNNPKLNQTAVNDLKFLQEFKKVSEEKASTRLAREAKRIEYQKGASKIKKMQEPYKPQPMQKDPIVTEPPKK